jgi:hypothetical protein
LPNLSTYTTTSLTTTSPNVATPITQTMDLGDLTFNATLEQPQYNGLR